MDTEAGAGRSQGRLVVMTGANGQRPISTRDELDRKARVLQQAFSGSEPDGMGDWLAKIRFGERYLEGTTVQPVGIAFATLPSGIAVPEQMARPAMPGDVLKTYATSSEVLGRSFTREDVGALLRNADLVPTLTACAALLRSFDEETVSEARDRRIASLFAEPHRSQAESAIRQGHALAVPQSTLLLAKLALQTSRVKSAAKRADDRWVIVGLLGIQDALGEEMMGSPEEIDGIIGDARAVAGLVQTQVFHSRPDVVSLLAHAHLRWRELPRKAGGFDRFEDLADAFEASTGVKLDDFVSIGLAVWARTTKTGELVITPDRLNLKLPPSRINRALSLFAASPTRLRRLLLEDDRLLGPNWSFDQLRRFPLVRIGRQGLLVLSPRLVLERVFSLVRWDLEQALLEAGQKALAGRAKEFWGHMCEQDAIATLASIVGDSASLKRLYVDADFRRAFATGHAGGEPKIGDFAIEYPGTWVVGEVTTSTLNRAASVGGSLTALEAGLGKALVEARQIESTIAEIDDDESRLTGLPRVPNRLYVPVLVMAEGFPVNPATTALIQHRLRRDGILQGPRIGPLHILDAEELTMAEGMAEQGVGLLDLLKGQEKAAFRDMALRDYVLLEERWSPSQPARLRRPFEAAWAPVLAAMRGDARA